MELERIGAISVGQFSPKILGQVDDGDGLEGAFLNADAAANAEGLGNKRYLTRGFHLYAQLPYAEVDTREKPKYLTPVQLLRLRRRGQVQRG